MLSFLNRCVVVLVKFAGLSYKKGIERGRGKAKTKPDEVIQLRRRSRAGATAAKKRGIFRWQ